MQGILLPEYEKVEKIEELELTLRKIKFPCFIKPIELTSTGKAKKLQNFKEALDIFKGLTAQKREERESQTSAIIEEYIPGKEFIIDGFVQQNNLYLFTIAESLYFSHKHFEKIGYLVRSETSDRTEIELYLKTVLSALNMEFGPFHAKIKMTAKGPLLIGLTLSFAKPYTIDLIKYSTGINYLENILRLFLGAPLTLHKIHHLNAGILFFYDLERKKTRSTQFFETLIKDPFIKEVKYYLQKGPTSLNPELDCAKIDHAIFVHQNIEHLKKQIWAILRTLS